jgi:hypothetical protein
MSDYNSNNNNGEEGEGEESILSLSTLLFAVVTLAVYILFLRPTPTVRNNNNNGTTPTTATTPPATSTATAARTTAVQQRRANALAGANANATARRQQQQQQNNNTTVATIQRRPPVLSENAIEVLKNCKAYPPHVEPRYVKSNSDSIGCYNLLSDSGLVSFNYLKAASAAASAATATTNSNNTTKDAPIDLTKKTATTTNANNNSNNKIQRQERAKILSRLFANSSTVATPPMKGSTFIIGVSYEQLLQKEKKQKLSITRVIKGLATYYNVLVIVAVDNDDDDNSNSNSNHHRYESTQKVHAQVVQSLRSSSGDEEGGENDDALLLLSEATLPSHRILLSNTKSSAVGRIALVRQLSSNIGLTIDFNPEVKIQLEKFGYNVSIIKNWYETFPSPSV